MLSEMEYTKNLKKHILTDVSKDRYDKKSQLYFAMTIMRFKKEWAKAWIAALRRDEVHCNQTRELEITVLSMKG